VTNWRVSRGLSWTAGTSDQRVWSVSEAMLKEYRKDGRKASGAEGGCCKVRALDKSCAFARGKRPLAGRLVILCRKVQWHG
jgi:hypothetical protein